MDPHAQQFIDLLARYPKGLKASEVARELYGSPVTESRKRKVRKLASGLRPKIVSAPACGYVLLRFATVEHVTHCVNSMRAQAQSMLADADAMDKAHTEILKEQFLLTLE